jgi:hypothetical protein
MDRFKIASRRVCRCCGAKNLISKDFQHFCLLEKCDSDHERFRVRVNTFFPVSFGRMEFGSTMKFLACGVVAASLTVSAFADVAYSSFGPSDSFNENTGWTIGATENQRVAFQFTSAVTGVLASVEFASFTVISGDLAVFLREDIGDALGDQLIVWGVAATAGPSAITTLVNPFPSVGLTAGSKYWLELRPNSSGTWAAWNENDQGLSSLAYAENTGGSGYGNLATSAFRVNTVPEPASMAALGLGALALVRKRRKSA